jgi:hypothetical protein
VANLSPIKGLNLPIITMDKIDGDPNLKTAKGPFAQYPPRMTESVLKNYDVYEALPHPNEEIVQNDYTCPPRRFFDKNHAMIEDEGLLSKRRNTRLSSRTDDYDPDKLSLKLVKNQINHLDFRPEIFKPEVVKHVQKIIKESRTPLMTRGSKGGGVGSIEVG